MEDFTFRNNAGEEFKFFLNEYKEISLNIKYEKEIISAFILSKKEAKNLKKYLKKAL